jgi:hypothetical protein
MLLLFPCPGTIQARQLPSEFPADLLIAGLVVVRHVWVIQWNGSPLQPLYDGPYAIFCQGPRSFTLQVEQQEAIIAVS